jgi:hypothetical protein
MNVEYKVVETKIEGDWGYQKIEMPYELIQMILKEMDEPNSDYEVGNAVVWNREIPDGFVWDTFDFVDPNNPHGKLLAGWDVPHLASRDVVTMVLSIYNEEAV